MSGLKAAIVPVTPFQQNCSIVFDDDSKRGAVVDPGGDVERIIDAIGKLNVTIERILLTHGHIDHAGGAAALRDALTRDDGAVPIEGPDQRDRFLLEGLEQQGREYASPASATSCRIAGWRKATKSRLAVTSSRCSTARAIRLGT